MINQIKGDATEPVGDGVKVIAHCANSVGAWGKGFVMSLTKKFPESEKMYREWFRLYSDYESLIDSFEERYNNEDFGLLFPPFELGYTQIVKVSNDIFVANMIGQQGILKKHPKFPPIRYDSIRTSLFQVLQFAKERKASVHIPYGMGCGLAGGRWVVIESLINDIFDGEEVNITSYEFTDRSSPQYIPINK